MTEDAERGSAGQMPENHIPCIRCLLQELDPARYEEEIARLLRLMHDEERAPEGEYERRLSICRGCEYLSKGTCNACGCYAELRAAPRNGRCPYKKW